MFRNIDKFIYYTRGSSLKESLIVILVILVIFILCCISEYSEQTPQKQQNTTIQEVSK